MSLSKFLIGDTIKISWVDSGVIPSDIRFSVFTGSETLVDSATMVSSLNGFFYGLHTVPNTPGWYVVETLATITSRPYKRRLKYLAVIQDVD